ncbi:hypothetical protein [Kitasatospora sp. NPDC088134]|uniref:hypothetical protein n=1 Tax=Kitasatospora sp. NPDC088134 TaxID=3364071 RepID=UPI00380254C3
MLITPHPQPPTEPPARIPEFDLLKAFPDLAALRDSAEQRRWEETAAFFAALTDPADRSTAMAVLPRTPETGAFLQQVAADRPGETLPLVLQAHRYVRLAWEARGNGRAKYVSAEQAVVFRRRLTVADKLISEVLTRVPDNTDARRLSLITSRGLGLGLTRTRARYDCLAEQDPHDYEAQSQLLQQLLPKWGGSWNAAFAFARQCRAAAPAGALDPALLAQAHIERWLNVGGKKDPAHLHRPETVDELVDAARASVLHPDFRGGYRFLEAHGLFAATFGLAGRHDLAAPHFHALNGYADEAPWDYLRSLTSIRRSTAYRRLRRHALRAERGASPTA